VIDVVHQISSVSRSVGDRTLEGGEARVLTISRVYDTTLEDLWEACTTAERIPRWMLPITGDLRVGGRYQLEGNAGGEVLTCDAPNSFTATWEFGGGVTWIEVRLTSEGAERTRFELSHIAPIDPHWDEFGPGAVGIGWELTFAGLALHLGSGGAQVDPEEFMAWSATEDGLRLMTLSGEAWREADIAGGADPATARAASDRAIQAYTAPPAQD
jgi:uncharacterized protein YndB with AHSA1/START domain